MAVRVDHTDIDQVRALVERIEREAGRLDLLVNDIWGGDELCEWGKSFWELDMERSLSLLRRGLETHLNTSRFAVPLLEATGAGLVVEVTDGDGLYYRSNLVYDLAKLMLMRLAFGMSEELAPHGVSALAISPGFLRSEAMLAHFGVAEDNWRDAIASDPHFLFSETPLYLGRAVAALAADPRVSRWSGRVLSTWQLQPEYGFVDADGATPDWGAHARAESFGRDQQASHARFISAFHGFIGNE